MWQVASVPIKRTGQYGHWASHLRGEGSAFENLMILVGSSEEREEEWRLLRLH